MSKLYEISRHPWMVKHIKEVVIWTGDLDLTVWKEQLRDFVDDETVGLPIGYLTDRLRVLLEEFDELEHLHQANSKHCKLESLSLAFAQLTNVEYLSILSQELPIPQSMPKLSEVWTKFRHEYEYDPKESQDGEVAAARYSNILMAAASFKLSLKSLTLDCMPMQTLDLIVHNDMEQLEVAIAEVHRLRIGITRDYEGGPNLTQRYRRFISAIQDLRNLDFSIEFMPFSWVPGWFEIFKGMPWANLKSLRLTFFQTSENALRSLLQEHSKSLRRLSPSALQFQWQLARREPGRRS
jgi:hypothetical protein